MIHPDMARQMPQTDVPVTGEQLGQMVDIDLCELVEGRIVPMSPTTDEHGRLELNLGAALRAFVRPRALGKVSTGEVGIYTRRNPDTIRAADVMFISNERYTRRGTTAFLDVAPELVVEILSARDTVQSLMQKVREYFAIGVRLVWVVDPKARLVYAYRSMTDVREFEGNDALPGDDVLPGFSLPLADIFED